METEPCLVS